MLVAFTAALYSWIPGAAALAWVMVGISVVQSFFGEPLNLPDVTNALCPLWWIGQYPSPLLRPSHLDTLGTAGIVLPTLSIAGFPCRDLRTSRK